jgi:hypothetical protein
MAAGPKSPATTARGPTALQRSIDTILNDPALAHGYWGVLVKSLKTGEPL